MNDVERARAFLTWLLEDLHRTTPDSRAAELVTLMAAVRAEERRRCARLAEYAADNYARSRGHSYVAHQIAESIRGGASADA